MARGWKENQERVALLNGLGKDLARRARSRCELCEEGGRPLSIVEVHPVPDNPDPDRCLMLCGECEAAAKSPEKLQPGENWRFLAQSVWSDEPVVQVVSVRLLKRQAVSQAWAREALEGLFLEPEIEEWVTEAG